MLTLKSGGKTEPLPTLLLGLGLAISADVVESLTSFDNPKGKFSSLYW